MNPKPCPFCGAEAKQWNFTAARVYRCSKFDCGASNYWVPLDRWNNRPEEDKAARSGALDFIKRVEDRAAELERIGENKHEWGVTEDWANLFDAFKQLSKEIREAK